MSQTTARSSAFGLVRALLVGALFVAGVVALMVWLMGGLREKVAPAAARTPRSAEGVASVEVVERTLPRTETAVGTIQPVHRTEVASRLLARVLEVRVAAGQAVAKGEVLVTLDDTDLRARLAQADAAIRGAEAGLDQARIEESRLAEAFAAGAATRTELDRVTNARKAVEAGLARAVDARREVEAVLEFATIRSPIDGVVVDKRVQGGDTVGPGQVVATLLDPKRMQLVASVRESLTRRLAVGDEVLVSVDALGHACGGTVSEIVPESASASRAFEVKVTGPCPEGIYAGMFGRLLIPVGDETVLAVPPSAVRTVGQLELVEVVRDGTLERRAIRTGRTLDDGAIEVLAGLSAGERIAVDAAAEAR